MLGVKIDIKIIERSIGKLFSYAHYIERSDPNKSKETLKDISYLEKLIIYEKLREEQKTTET
jgi:hypothetical protein